MSGSGLRSPLLPYRGGAGEMSFDLRRHLLTIDTTIGERRELVLEPRSVADFYREFLKAGWRSSASRLLLSFLQSTYDAAADLAVWDRTSLESRTLADY